MARPSATSASPPATSSPGLMVVRLLGLLFALVVIAGLVGAGLEWWDDREPEPAQQHGLRLG